MTNPNPSPIGIGFGFILFGTDVHKGFNKHIIARNDFEKVQTLMSKTKRRAPKPKNGEKSIFCDLLLCGDCHGKLRHHTNTVN